MNEYTFTVKDQNSISVCFNVEHEKPLAIGEKMNEIDENACMNGYNWEAFFNYYLPKYDPDVFDGLDTDSEAGTYVAYYDRTPENEVRAEQFVEIICELVENAAELCRIVGEEGTHIEWY